MLRMRENLTGLRKSKDIRMMRTSVGTEVGRWPANNACHQWASGVLLGMGPVSPGQFWFMLAGPM